MLPFHGKLVSGQKILLSQMRLSVYLPLQTDRVYTLLYRSGHLFFIMTKLAHYKHKWLKGGRH